MIEKAKERWDRCCILAVACTVPTHDLGNSCHGKAKFGLNSEAKN